MLNDYCEMETPPPASEQEYLSDGPPFILSYHPALGPIYEVIAQKVRGGRLDAGAELVIQLADVEIVNLI